MGTSKSYGGPADISKLLPSWALPGAAPSEEAADGPGDVAAEAAPDADSDGSEYANESDTASGWPSETDSAGENGVSPGSPVSPPPAPRVWQAARRSLGTVARAQSEGRDYKRAGKDYVRARGGARAAARGSVAGRHAAANLAGFLANVATFGGAQAAQRLGLAPLVGRSADEVLSALTNALAPTGALLEDAVARQAVAETLAKLYERLGIADDGFALLESLTPDDLREVITDSVSTYVFYRWVHELGIAIERNAISPKEAVVMEREMRAYIRETLKLDLSGRDVLNIDWRGAEGLSVMEAVFAEAYGLLGSAL